MMKLFKEIYIEYLRNAAERENISVTETKLTKIFEEHGLKAFELITEDLMDSWKGLSIDEIKEDFISLFNQETFIAYEDAVKYLETKMKYLKTDIYPTEKTREWLLENTRTELIDGKPVHYCAKWMNLKLYFQTDDIRIYWNNNTVIFQIKDDEPEEMKRSEFREKYLKPAVLFFENNFTRIHRHKRDARQIF